MATNLFIDNKIYYIIIVLTVPRNIIPSVTSVRMGQSQNIGHLHLYAENRCSYSDIYTCILGILRATCTEIFNLDLVLSSVSYIQITH